MQTPITREKLRDHLTYSWWKYVLLVIVAIVGWGIVYPMTAYRPPEEKKVIMGVYSAGSSQNATVYMQQVLESRMTDMELMEPMYILPDAQYGEMILMTRVAARACDIYVLPGAQFQTWAAQGACQALDVVAPEIISELEIASVSLSRGRRTNEDTGETHIYGIPCRELPAAQLLFGMNDVTDMYICVFHETGNDENVLKFLQIMVHDLLIEPTITPAA